MSIVELQSIGCEPIQIGGLDEAWFRTPRNRMRGSLAFAWDRGIGRERLR